MFKLKCSIPFSKRQIVRCCASTEHPVTHELPIISNLMLEINVIPSLDSRFRQMAVV